MFISLCIIQSVSLFLSLQTLLLNGEDINELEVSENSRGVTVASLGVVDVDSGQTATFSISGSSQFYIDGDVLKVRFIYLDRSLLSSLQNNDVY